MDTHQNAYVEHIVKRKDPGFWKILRVISAALLALSFLFMMVSPAGILLLAAAGGLFFYVSRNASLEYEYLYIEGDLSVDAIMNRSARKRVVDISKDDLILVAPFRSDSALSELRSGQVKLQDLSGDGPENLKYAVLYRQNNERLCIYIEMTDALLREMRYYSPSKIR